MTDSADTNWINFWQTIAAATATKSKDRSTQVGAVIVAEDQAVLSMGWNGFPRGVDDDCEERHQRPAKYVWTEHAERNAIFNAARHGIRLEGSTIHVTHFPCCDCARAIAQSGIKRVCAPEPSWGDDHIQATQRPMESAMILRESGVRLTFV